MSRRSLPWRGALLLALLAVAVPLVLRGVGKIRRGVGADRVCAAAAEGRYAAAVELSDGVGGADPAAQRVAECRAVALLETGRREEAVSTLEEQLARRAGDDWLPLPPLTALLIEERRDRGDLQEAADLAYRAAGRYPEAYLLRFLELDLRCRLEDETAVLADARERLQRAGAAESRLRLELAARHGRREE
ncbi:MAG: hypothetical protein R3325_10600, partial [Thermoanaerobaculia bacterium]|nr:hypothetical protein [Thermoanaerobaculia bacterium]